MTAATRPRVVLIGNYYVDLVFAGLPQWPAPGQEIFASHILTVPGGAYTHARALHRLGVDVTWPAELGNDSYSAIILEAAATDGLDQSAFINHDQPVRRVSVAATYRGERGFISFKDPITQVDPTELIKDRRPDAVLMVEMPTLEHLERVAGAAGRVGALVVLDPQHTEMMTADETMRRILDRVDVFVPNAAEAKYLTGQDSLSGALEDLLRLTSTVVIKNGAHGAIAATRHACAQASAPAVAAVDTIGAGDCFDAGLVAAMTWGRPLEEALRLAVLCGSLSTREYGGSGTPTLDELLTHSPELVPWAAWSTTTTNCWPT